MFAPFMTGVILGLIIGGLLGVLIMSLMVSAGDQWDEIDDKYLAEDLVSAIDAHLKRTDDDG